MYKRAQKRERRKQRDEELGLSGDVIEILSMQDTDSEESSSSSNSEGSTTRAGIKRKRDDDSDAKISEGEESEASNEFEGSHISVKSALENPLYELSAPKDVIGCILCPGKLLKNLQMQRDHVESAVSGWFLFGISLNSRYSTINEDACGFKTW